MLYIMNAVGLLLVLFIVRNGLKATDGKTERKILMYAAVAFAINFASLIININS